MMNVMIDGSFYILEMFFFSILRIQAMESAVRSTFIYATFMMECSRVCVSTIGWDEPKLLMIAMTRKFQEDILKGRIRLRC